MKDKEINKINKMLEDKSINPMLKDQLEKKKDILINDKQVNK